MSDKTEDTGVIEAVLHRLNEYRLPRLLDLKKRVDSGETLTDSDIDFLEQVLEDGRAIDALIKRRPEVQPLAAKVAALHNEIVTKGVENETKSRGK